MDPNADSSVIWINGELRPFQEATTHVLAHSLHYGSAAFEGIRAYKGGAGVQGRTQIFRAREHLERFRRSVRVFDTDLPYDTEVLMEAMRSVVKDNGFDACYVRPIAWIGPESRGLKLPVRAHLSVAIAAWRWGRYLGDDALAKGIRVVVASLRRPDASSSMPWAKLSGNYLNSILARREASQRGADEALLLDQQGFVAEGSGENIFVVRDGAVLTPPAATVLPGITRASVMTLAQDLGLPVYEQPLTRNAVYEADEVFFTGTAVEVTPIVEVDGYKVGDGRPGPITKKLAELYQSVVCGEVAKYRTWLTPV